MIRKSLILVALLLVVAACDDAMKRLFPETLLGQPMTEYVHGEDALAEVNKLHGKAIRAEDGAVARYGSGDEVSEIWISRAADGREARRQAGKMVHMMYENPKSPFQYRKRFDFEGVPVYPFVGMGKSHLVFFTGDLIYWVTVPAGDERQALSEIL
ncbi:hypothetical protein [Salidesulfovibrio brasiliensis]